VPAELPLEDEGLTVADAASYAAARGPNRWEWIRPVLLGASVIVPLSCAIVVAADPGTTGTERAVAFVLAAAYAGWSVACDRKLCAARADGGALWPMIHVVGAAALFAAMVLVDPLFFFVAFLLYWQIFSTLELVLAIPVAIAFSVEMLLLQLHYSDHSVTDDPSIVVGGIISVGFGIFMAVWIGGIIEQSGQRAELIDELEATRAELADLHHRAGVEVERERLRQEIHDTLAQGFTSIVMLAQATESALEAGADEQARNHVRSIEATARENLAEARNLVEGAGPAPLTDSTLADALRRLTERIGTDSGIEATAEIHANGDDRSPAIEVAVLRAAQEALTNVRRHADATRVALTYRSNEEGIVLEVTDDGAGFDVDHVADDPSHVGLRGMRARLEEVGGDVLVDSAPGRGTTVIVTLP
jgi:signal transduction histidine kinase